MRVFDFLFGKKKAVRIPVLGELKSERMKDDNQTKIYSWYGSFKLGNNSNETFLVLEGDNRKPFQDQINSITDLIVNWNEIHIKTIDEMISNRVDLLNSYKNWKTDFYIGAVTPSDDEKGVFEITLEQFNVKKTDFLSIEFKNNSIVKLEVYW